MDEVFVPRSNSESTNKNASGNKTRPEKRRIGSADLGDDEWTLVSKKRDQELKMDETTLRHRKKTYIEQNGVLKHEKAKQEDAEFTIRESPLTILMTSAHIRSIYHIFLVILVILLCDTTIYDLVESGKINVGQHTVAHGFGDVKRGVKLWLYVFFVAVAFYPLLCVYAVIGKIVAKNSGLRRLWTVFGLFGLAGVQLTLLSVPIWDLGREHLALASSVTVTCEMFRFSMKIHAIAVSCSSRCFDGSTPLPSFRHYLYFLFAPTLLYRDQYPRTKKIRWGVPMWHFSEVAAIIFYNSFLWERFILPYWSDFGKSPSVEAGAVVRAMFACVLPGVISFLCGFYCLLHAWHNAFAEIMTFGDRLFYEEWWTCSRFSNYFRLWNRVVHSWLRDYLYRPLAPRVGRAASTFLVFFVSSLAHEVVLALSFGFFYPVLMLQFGGFGMLMVPLTSASGRRYPNVLNLVMWLTFFLGNGLLWSLYPMEYFARKNCPPSESDSFFVPKSWSCPEILFKPNWSFQNPLTILS